MTVGQDGRLLIRNGCVVNDDRTLHADVFIEGGIIKEVGSDLEISQPCKTIDASGMFLLPGGIETRPFVIEDEADTHPSQAGESDSALRAGSTTIVYSIMGRGDLCDGFTESKRLLSERRCCDFCLQMCIRKWDENTVKSMTDLCENGVNSFKILVAGRDVSNDKFAYGFFKHCSQLGALAVVELRKCGSREKQRIADSTRRMISIGSIANCALEVENICDKASADSILTSRRKGVVVFGEASLREEHITAKKPIFCSQLDTDLATDGYLRELLSNGYLHTAKVTREGHYPAKCNGNASCTLDHKEGMIPNGHQSGSSWMEVLWESCVKTGRMDQCTFVSVTSSNSAKMHNLYPRKGRIDVGSDGDVVVWKNTDSEHNASGPVYVISSGRVVVEHNKIDRSALCGRFVPLSCNGDYMYSRLKQRQKVDQPQKVEREPYDGPVIHTKPDQTPDEIRRNSNPIVANGDCFYGTEIEEKKPKRVTKKKVVVPPGGQTSPLW